MHILSGCKVLAGSDYLKRHNNALMVLTVEWAKQESLSPSNSVWYKQKWSKGTVLEKNSKKICWDFEFTMRKTTSARRPDVMIENDEEKKLWIVDMACPNEKTSVRSIVKSSQNISNWPSRCERKDQNIELK